MNAVALSEAKGLHFWPTPCGSFAALRMTVCIVLWTVSSGALSAQPLLPVGTPSGPMISALVRADSMIAAAIAREQIPGAVFVVTQGGRIVHERAFGHAQLYDFGNRRLAQPKPMTITTVFDLASVTKVMATTMAVMLLAERGTIELDSPVYRYLPDFRGLHLDSITVRHLLTHSAGLVQWQPIYYGARNRDEAYQRIRNMPLQWGVGAGRHYSDLGFMLLGAIVERVSRKRLDMFIHEALYARLGLRTTMFQPLAYVVPEIAATSHGNPYERKMVYDTLFGYDYDGDPTAWNGWRQQTLIGQVNDGNAWHAFGGIAGHAGLFSTGKEMATLIQLLLNRGEFNGRSYIDSAVIDTFTRRGLFDHALGWMVPKDAPEGSFNHTGFTGTFVMGVPKYGLGIVLLTNRQNVGVNASGNYPSVTALQNAVVETILAAAAR
jgi:CubicO group peptidase (beta-lactamase class C family)